MTKFICKNCGYRFDSWGDMKDKRCNYCGEKALVKEPSAEELVEEE